MKNLSDTIRSDYTEILKNNLQFGAVSQRNTVCQPIYGPIEKDYKSTDGYLDEANLGLGCGFPFNYCGLEKGMQVVDLGCAAGIDSFILSEKVGKSGLVTGIDLTESLIRRATEISKANNITNTRFTTGDITNLPFEDQSIDAATSNGVFSLIPDINKVFSEVFRVLQLGGNFCFADIVNETDLSPQDYEKLKAFTGCLNGIRKSKDYVEALTLAGFENVDFVEERVLDISYEIAPVTNKVKIITIKAAKN